MMLCCLLLALPCLAVEEGVPELLRAGNAALLRDQFADAERLGKQALERAEKLAKANEKEAGAWFLRGCAHELLQQHRQAIADFTQAIALDPMLAEAYDQRGSEQFKLGNIEASVADFDRYLKLQPQAGPGHWKRGISLYYAKNFDEGRKQFLGYEKVDTNDVENAVWHYLCAAQLVGPEKARQGILKIGRDQRIPMMTVYDLFAGKVEPKAVLEKARAGEPTESQLNTRLFYAHLYLGLFFEAQGKVDQARTHLDKAVEHRIGHYMWDVAHVHRNRLRK